MSRHRWSGPDPEKPRPGRREDEDGPAQEGRRGERRDGGGTVNGHADGRVAPRINGFALNGSARNGTPRNGSAVNGSAVNGSVRDGAARNGSAVNGSGTTRPRPTPRPRVNGSGASGDGPRRRGAQARPSSIADFARSDRTHGAPGRESAGSTAAGPAADTSRIPAARNGADVERTVVNPAVVPTQRDRSAESGPHRTSDRTAALPTVPPPAVPGPRTSPARPDAPTPGVPPATAPRRAAEPAPSPDADPTARVGAVRPAVSDPGTAHPGTAHPGTAHPGTAHPGTAHPGDADPSTAFPAGSPRVDPAPTDDRDAGHTVDAATDRAPATSVVPAPPPGTVRSEGEPEPTPTKNRLLGVDVARGVALLGIIAVHALVEGTDDGAPATNYLVFGGRSAALFALLAGVALAFMTGRKRVRWGRAGFGAAAAMVAARAGVLLVIGLALGWTDPEIAAVILPYYAVMFLLAIPLLLLPTGVLACLTVVLVGAVPVLSQLVRPGLPVPTLDNPHLVDVVTDPLGLLSELTVTGAYPAATWLAYLAAGLVIGRLRLSSLRTAWALFGAGTAAAFAAAGASWWLLGPAGGYAHIAAATPPAQLETAPTVADFVAAFPDGVTPTTTWWWLATIAPHSGTPLDLVQTIGSAMGVLGAALLLAGIARPAVARPLGFVLRPLAAAGSMTLTLYVGSLLFMNSPLDDYGPLEGYLWQIGAALVIGTAWRRAVGRGPLEAVTSTVAKAARDRVRRGRARDRVGGADRTGPSVADAEARR